MRKSFFKKFTLALAAVIALSSMPASAASTPALNKKSKNLYLNNETVGNSYTFTVKNKVKGSSYKWSSSNTAVASVKEGKVTGLKIGSATITCKITLPTKKTQTLTAKVNVKANATAVKISNPIETVGVGEKVYDFNRTMTVKNATDKTYWFIDAASNTAGATIDSKGIISTKQAGEFKLSCKTFQNKTEYANNNPTSVSEEITVKVVSGILKAEQTHANKVAVTFDTSMKDSVTKDNISLYDSTTKATVYVKDVTFSDDGKVVTVETYQDFDKNAAYQFEYDKKTINFTVKTGAVDQVVLKAEQVQYSTPKELTVNLYSNNIDVTSTYIDKVSLVTDNGYTSGRELTLFQVGDTAKVKAVYHTGTYSSTGEEIIVESPLVTFTAMEEVAVSGTFQAYTVIETSSNPNWSKVNHTVPANKENMIFVVKGTDSSGKEMISLDNSDIKFDSSDSSILIVSEDGTLYPIKEGTAYVKAIYGKTTQVFPVTISKESVVTTLTLNKTSAILSNFIEDSVAIQVSAKDQYGNTYTPYFVEYPTLLSSPKDSALDVSLDADNKVIFSTNNAPQTKAGVYTYKIEADGKSAVVTLTVKTPNFDRNNNVIQGPVLLDLDMKTLDVSIDKTNPSDKYITIGAYKTSTNGVKTETLNLSSYIVKITNPNGKDITDPKLAASDYSGELIGDRFYGLSVSGAEAKQAKAGKYNVEIRETSTNKLVTTTSFTITNTSSKPGVTVKKYEVRDCYSVLAAVQEAFTVTSGEITDVTFTKLTDKIDASSGSISYGTGTYSIYIKSIVVDETLNNGVNLTHTIDVAKTIKVIN